MTGSRKVMWDLVYSLIDEKYQSQICLHEGIKKNEEDIADAISTIEELAARIEKSIIAEAN